MVRGYNGKVLFVDLTSGSIKEESLPEKVYRDFIGGTGLGVKVLYRRMKAKADPLGPENMLGFLTGPLTEGLLAGSSRLQVVGKSPLTGGWGDCNCGGFFAPQLKAAGYDAVFFSGISPKPAYLLLHDGKAELKDASHLWGKDCVQTEDSIRDELGDKRVKVVSIGPAGEAKSFLAAIMHEGCAAARSGLAAVMGAKRLKAIAARGRKRVPLADNQKYEALRKNCVRDIRETEHPWGNMFKGLGTCADLSPSVVAADAPIKNWALFGEEGFPNHAKISGNEVAACSGGKWARVPD